MIDNNMRKKREQYLTLLEEKKRRIERNQMKYFEPYPWQKRFYASGLDNMQRLLMAANQVGKTKGASFEFAFHVTGRYRS